MRIHVAHDLEDALDLALASQEPVELIGSGRPEDRFLSSFVQLSTRFGEPDHPGDFAVDWRRSLGFGEGMLAVWDFDYYVVSLRFAGHTVLVQKHTHAQLRENPV
jgi:hypothetical protein